MLAMTGEITDLNRRYLILDFSDNLALTKEEYDNAIRRVLN